MEPDELIREAPTSSMAQLLLWMMLLEEVVTTGRAPQADISRIATKTNTAAEVVRAKALLVAASQGLPN